MRKAVELLVEEEILVKRQGIGTFVSQKKLCRNINGFMGFTQSCLAEGNTAGAQLVCGTGRGHHGGRRGTEDSGT